MTTSAKELQRDVEEKRTELALFRIAVKLSTEKRTHRIKGLRRNIARLLTAFHKPSV